MHSLPYRIIYSHRRLPRPGIYIPTRQGHNMNTGRDDPGLVKGGSTRMNRNLIVDKNNNQNNNRDLTWWLPVDDAYRCGMAAGN